ncbi:hypothetical protein BDZ90DRAFT_126719 [Jaminaea rosea]|uniref:Uncharacterized protein n=1 Tax=Jaminaea rosea TaxID=1569628 RepID=A0A316UGG2_9BASI|nr:hypothetical protein BDZ90DRAFT_126719 [Jaminaea rosea]PWN24329.1 hypothetical protein BDZ90DRAFT_126719 [Jaminaea rosea]
MLALLVSLTEAYEDSRAPATSSSALVMPSSSSNVAGGQSDAPSAYSDTAACKVQAFTASPHDLIPHWGPCPIAMSKCSNLVCPFDQSRHGGVHDRTDNLRWCDASPRQQWHLSR